MRRVFYFLVDFDNATNWNERFSAIRPVESDVRVILYEIAEHLDNALSAIGRGFDEFNIRLYGGWVGEGGAKTDLGHWISKTIYEKTFRIRNRVINFELTRGLYGFPELIFEQTVFYKKGLGYVKKADAFSCPNAPCLFWNTIKNRGKICPDSNCELRAVDLFVVPHQKTVDTVISLDLVNIAKEGYDPWVAVFTSDYDIVPALILARRYNSKVFRVFRSDTPPLPFSMHLLEHHSIKDIPV